MIQEKKRITISMNIDLLKNLNDITNNKSRLIETLIIEFLKNKNEDLKEVRL